MYQRSPSLRKLIQLMPSFLVLVGVAISFQNCGESFQASGSLKSYEENSDPVVPGNIPPVVIFTAPDNGAAYTQGTAVTVVATATDADGTINRVEVLVDGVLSGSDTTAPYSIQIPGLTQGTYPIQVRAVDNVGGYATSASRNITVNPPILDPLANCTLPGYTLPSWADASTVNDKFYYIGLGIGGPTQPLNLETADPLDLPYTYVNGTRNVSAINCNGASNGLNANCNLARLRITRNNNAECSSGTSTITARPSDGCPDKTFPAKQFVITVVNACPASDVVNAAAQSQTQAALGSRVAIANNIAGGYMVVSAPNYTDGARTKVGAAFVYRKTGSLNSNATIDNNNWTLESGPIIPANAQANQGLLAVSAHGNYFALGGPGVSGVAGRVYIYEYSSGSWQQQYIIFPPTTPNPSDYLQFGFRVEFATNGDLFVSAPGEDHSGLANAGAVYQYKQDPAGAWNLFKKITAATPVAQEMFGYSIALSRGANELVVGAPYVASLESPTNFGSVYIFKGGSTALAQTHRIKLDSTDTILQFGASVHVDGTRIAVGAPVRNASRGAVYLYNLADGALSKGPIVPENVAVDDRFGTVVQLVGNDLYASAPGDETQTGSIRKFNISTTPATETYNLISRAAERSLGALFGNSFAISGSQIAVGSPGRDSGGFNNAGVAFVIAAPQ